MLLLHCTSSPTARHARNPAGKKQKKMQTKEDQIYGIFAEDSGEAGRKPHALPPGLATAPPAGQQPFRAALQGTRQGPPGRPRSPCPLAPCCCHGGEKRTTPLRSAPSRR